MYFDALMVLSATVNHILLESTAYEIITTYFRHHALPNKVVNEKNK
jgi:hypothetical protein